jgi:hypothetical protein
MDGGALPKIKENGMKKIDAIVENIKRVLLEGGFHEAEKIGLGGICKNGDRWEFYVSIPIAVDSSGDRIPNEAG